MSMDITARALARQPVQKLAATGAGEGAAMVGFRSPALASVARTAADKLSEWVTPADFGPVGTADDTAVFAAALQSGKAVYVPPLSPVAGNKPQVAYMVSQLVIPNGAVLVGQYGATLIRQTAGANRDLVVLAGPNVSNFTIEGLMLDGNAAANTTGCGINIIGPTAGVGAYNPQGSTDPYFTLSDLLIFNCAGDGLRLAGAAADGTAMLAGGSVISNIRTFNTKNRGAYFNLYDAYISNIDCGVTGKQGIVFDLQCGALFVNAIKGWYTGQITPAQGEAIVVGGGQCTLKQVFAQANIPGHGIRLKGFYESEIDFVIQGAGNITGFGSTPAYLFVDTGSTGFRASGVCSQQSGAPAGAINLVDFGTGTGVHNNYKIDIAYSGTYTALIAGDTQFPVGGGGVTQSIILNGREHLGRTLGPIWPAGSNPTTGWAEYCDASMNNAVVLRSSSGQTIPITPLNYTIAALPAASAALKGGRAFVTNGVAAPALGAVPSTTGSTYCPVYCDGAAWRYG